MTLKERFADPLTTPTGEALESSSPEFLDIFNGAFHFHEAEILSSRLDLARGELDLLLNYIAKFTLHTETMGDDVIWRKVRLRATGVFRAQFLQDDPEFGSPHHMERTFNVEYLRESDPAALARLERACCSDLVGADLDYIRVGTWGEGGPRRDLRMEFNWLFFTVPRKVVYESLWCTGIVVEFASEPSR